MANVTAIDNIVEIKKELDEKINKMFYGRTLNDLSVEELLSVKNTLKEYGEILDEKIEIQQEKLEAKKMSIKNKIESINS